MEKRAESIARIALIGAESTGKTTLAQQLAAHYNTLWVPEFSRNYVAGLARAYTLDDILLIAKQQLEEESAMMKKANRFLFADTELIISKVWCEDVFGECPGWISEQLHKTRYDLYLLTDTDLDWEQDPVRENPHRRKYFFDLYKKHLDELGAAYETISGKGDDRLRNALNAIEKNFPR
jgi:NadR type nicotinamide-nucleotide adenylyltransferase